MTSARAILMALNSSVLPSMIQLLLLRDTAVLLIGGP
jgi:hypothetical protein